MTSLLRLFSVAIALLGLLSSSHAADAKPINALLVCGGCCHDYEAQKKILSEGISARANVTWKIVHENAPKGQDERNHKVSIYTQPDWWKGFDVIVHDDCFGMVNDDAFIEGITAAHKAGVHAVILHCANHSYRSGKTDEWRKLVGISSFRHEKRRDLEVKVTNSDHPVMKGFPATWPDKNDELYVNEKVWENCVPLAQAYGEESKKDHAVVWVNTYEKAKVFNTSLGHTNETVSDPVYLDLVTRGLLWTCGKLKDDGTPTDGYAAAKK